MHSRILFLTLIIATLTKGVAAQLVYRSPVDIPILLAGNFGEVRNNHYHAGLDIRTQQQEGLPVHAVADGYLSRAKIAGAGYGKVLYIAHPNGQTSVYAHLREFNGNIADYIRSQQFAQEKSEIELFPPADSVKVYAGQVIAYSGNTGSSAGPHLHFEIRDTKTEEVINPQLEGFRIPDNVPPDVSAITVFPLSPGGKVNGSPEPKTFYVSAKNGYTIAEPIQALGQIGIGASATDRATGSANANGVYSLALFMDSVMHYSQKLDRHVFTEARCINALTNYAEKLSGKSSVQKLFASGCVDFSGIEKGPGILSQADFESHPVSVIVADIEGNFREIKMKVVFSPLQKTDRLLGGKLLSCSTAGFYKDKDLDILFPEHTLFDTLDFSVQTLPKPSTSALTPEYVLASRFIPVYNLFSLTINCPNIPVALREKAVIAYKDRGTTWISEGGTLRGDEITQKVKRFGSYTVMLDMLPPKIAPLNNLGKNAITENTELVFRISDNFSGIVSYRVEVNGQWVLTEFDSKKARLSCKIKDTKGAKIPAGRNTIRVELIDYCKNKTEWTSQITVR